MDSSPQGPNTYIFDKDSLSQLLYLEEVIERDADDVTGQESGPEKPTSPA